MDLARTRLSDEAALRAVKITHTIVWAFFAGCILAIPWFAWQGRLKAAMILIVVTMIEVAVLFLNRMRCPLTGIAARYTDDRPVGFDIFLPQWLARYNKLIFGTILVLAEMYLLASWLANR